MGGSVRRPLPHKGRTSRAARTLTALTAVLCLTGGALGGALDGTLGGATSAAAAPAPTSTPSASTSSIAAAPVDVPFVLGRSDTPPVSTPDATPDATPSATQGSRTYSVRVNQLARTGDPSSPVCPTGPAQYTFQWFLDGAPVAGQTSDTYVGDWASLDRVRVEVTTHRDGHAVLTRVYGVDAIGATVDGVPTATADTPTPAPALRTPTLSGTHVTSTTVTASSAEAPGAPEHPTFPELRIWVGPAVARGCQISDSVKQVPTAYATGSTLRVTSIVRRSTSDATVVEVSPQSDAFDLRPSTPGLYVALHPQHIVGTSLWLTDPQVGSSLDGTTIRWLRGSTPIAGQTGRSYTVTEADFGATIRPLVQRDTYQGVVDVTISPASYAVPLGTLSVSVINNGPSANGYGGGAPLGAVLTPTVNAWCEAGTSPTLTRQWLRDGRPIAGATGTSYRIGLDDLMHAITVKVTATAARCRPAVATMAAAPARPFYPQLWQRTGGFITWQGATSIVYGPGGNTCLLTNCWPAQGWGLVVSVLRTAPGLSTSAGNTVTTTDISHPQFWTLDASGTLWWRSTVYDKRAVTTMRDVTRLIGTNDLGNDGVTDLMVTKKDGSSWYYRSNGVGGLLAPVRTGSGWHGMTAVTAVGDFDRDGRQDLVGRRPDGTLWLYRGNGAGGWTGSVRIGSGWNVMNVVQGVGDWDGDGKVDLGAREARTGRTWIYRGNGAGGFLPRVAIRALPGVARG